MIKKILNSINFHIRVLNVIGIYDYIFFFIYLHGDEFSDRLSLINNITVKRVWGTKLWKYVGFNRLDKRRKAAHKIGIIVTDIAVKYNINRRVH